MLKTSILKAALVIIIALAMVVPANAVSTKTKDLSLVSPASQTLNRGIIFEDGFESYNDFVIEFPPWTNIDVDGDPTFGHSAYTWENQWLPQAFIIFNPDSTTPPSTEPAMDSHSGAKYAACFNADNAGYINDDWMVTPLLVGSDFDAVSLWGKAYSLQYTADEFQVCVSTTDMNPSSFTPISPVVAVTLTWTQYSYSLNDYDGQSIYIGIHCVSIDSWFLMIDDFEVTGVAGEDTTPPVTTCSLEGTMEGDVYVSDVTVTLTATDENSGVNYTRYKLDDGAWTPYTAPFVVSTNGAHTVTFYSVDNAGNQETEKTTTFTIQKPVDIIITIKGGFGVSATIKNTGTTDLTNVGWTINLDGGLILLGKTKTGEIPSILAGEEVTVKDFVFGLGKTTITVSAGNAEVAATGTVILFFVIGVA